MQSLGRYRIGGGRGSRGRAGLRSRYRGWANAAQESKASDAPAGNAENGKRIFTKTAATNATAAKAKARS